jgi:hypothetical protein
MALSTFTRDDTDDSLPGPSARAGGRARSEASVSEAMGRFGWSIALLVAGAALLVAWATPRVRATLARRRSGSARGGAVADIARDAEELAVRLAAQIDARAERLERLIEAADSRLAALEELADAGMLHPSPGAAPAPTGRAVGAVSIEPDGLSRRVYELADSGNAPAEIARALGEHVGKVQLILALRG